MPRKRKTDQLGKDKIRSKPTGVGSSFHWDSKDEIKYAEKLELLKRAGEIQDWIRITKGSKDYPIRLNGKHICYLEPDFIILTKDGIKEVHETKGFMKNSNGMAVWEIKKKLFEAYYPNIPYRVIWSKPEWQRAYDSGVKRPWAAKKSKKAFIKKNKGRIIDVDAL